VVRGCHALELKRIVMASPFPEDQDERLVKFLTQYDIEVVAFRGLGCPNVDVIWELPPASGYELATSLLSEHPNVDGIYMLCNKWRTVSVIERLEKDHGKPVVSNTQARVWEALRLMNIAKPHRVTGGC
jgi:maleate isomerase